MKQLYDNLSQQVSRQVTKTYSTSFSLGIRFLAREYRAPVYAVYGFVRLADEIVDSFHGYDKAFLLEKFVADTDEALTQRISVNPVLNAFQDTYYRCGITKDLVDAFFDSMRMDLYRDRYEREEYNRYIYGSAESVGLMCLRIFVKGDEAQYRELAPFAKKLGSAFQKVNFLRDAREDFRTLGRSYFPGVNLDDFSREEKTKVEREIREEFDTALEGIRRLPPAARNGVYLAYFYYRKLFEKIVRTDSREVMSRRIRIADHSKLVLMLNSYMRLQFNLL